jgi:hypothetical protein
MVTGCFPKSPQVKRVGNQITTKMGYQPVKITNMAQGNCQGTVKYKTAGDKKCDDGQFNISVGSGWSDMGSEACEVMSITAKIGNESTFLDFPNGTSARKFEVVNNGRGIQLEAKG